MTLKFRRNFPLVLVLIGILSLLTLTIGNQPIVSYTVNLDALQSARLTDWLTAGGAGANLVNGASVFIAMP